jgi:lipoprotein LprG
VRLRTLLLCLAGLVLVVSGCSGDSGGDADPAALAKRLSAARTAIDSAETVTVSLSTSTLPDGVTGLLSAKGEGNHSPAFKGTVKVITGGSTLSADVVAAEGKVKAKTSFAPIYLTVDPATLKAPDPASLLDPDDGITQILEKTTKLTEGKKSRDGSDVLTTVKGRLPGDIVKAIIPSADADKTFSVSYRLTDDDELRDATVKGPFYPGTDAVSYKVTLTTSDTPVEIKLP